MSKRLMKVGKTCVSCQKIEEVEVESEAYIRWQNGDGNIQDLMPKMHPMYREVLIQSMCLDCLSRVFNTPKPGEDWGEPVGECCVCGCPIYERNGDTCPSCHELWNIEDNEEDV